MKKLRYNKKPTSRIPAVADASRRHLTARSGLEVMLYELLQHALVQKERRNDLLELTPQRARELYEAYRRGEMADVQLMWDQLEERDETLFTVLHARLGALAEMPWAVNIDADLSEDKQALAEQQQQLANELLAAVENLPEALTHLGMADFRGVAALEVTGNAARMRWEVIEPWNLCRPMRRGPWYYNAEATSTPTRPEELDPAAVIIREAQPIDLPAMFLICAKYLSMHAWDAFLEVFGIPNIFLEMPPATPQDKALEFDAIVQRLIGEGRGTVPSGAKFHTVETSKDNTQSFEARAKWCNEAIIQLATGGLLTVTTQSGSGTLAGNAHSDSFSRLCAASARSISAAINRQFLRPALQEAFPHTPILVSFELAPEPVDDRLQVAQLIATLASAGYRAKDDDVAELMNMQFTAANINPTDLYATKAVGYVPTMEAIQTRLGMPLKPAPVEGANSAPMVQNMQHTPITNTAERDAGAPLSSREADELPLNEGELVALRALGGELNPAQVAADAEYMTREMMAGLREPITNREGATAEDDMLIFESFQIGEADAVANCNQYAHDANCTVSTTAAALRETPAGQTLQGVLDELRADSTHPSVAHVVLNPANQRTVDKVRELCGRDISQHKHSVSPSELHHSRKKHTDMTDEDFMLMLDMHDNWDALEYENRSNIPKIKYTKTYDGREYTLVERIGRTPRTPDKPRMLQFSTEFKVDEK